MEKFAIFEEYVLSPESYKVVREMRWSHSTHLGKSYPEITFPVKNVLVYFVQINYYLGRM